MVLSAFVGVIHFILVAVTFKQWWILDAAIEPYDMALFVTISLMGVGVFAVFIFYMKNLLVQRELQRLAAFRKKNELEQVHYKRLEEVYGNFRGLTHDMDNYLSHISAMTAKQLLSGEEGTQEGALTASRQAEILAEEIRGRIAAAGEAGIKWELFVEPGFDLDRLDDFSVIGILTNLLDHALEAAGKGGQRI